MCAAEERPAAEADVGPVVEVLSGVGVVSAHVALLALLRRSRSWDHRGGKAAPLGPRLLLRLLIFRAGALLLGCCH